MQITSQHSTEAPAGASGANRWNARDHLGHICLIASSGRIEETPGSKYSADTAIADVVVVFRSATEVLTYIDAYISPRWMRARIDPNVSNPTGGALLAGRLNKRALVEGGNEAWVLDSLTDATAASIQQWVDANLAGDTDTGFQISTGVVAVAPAPAPAAAVAPVQEAPVQYAAPSFAVDDGDVAPF